jgi:hypothetical protein
MPYHCIQCNTQVSNPDPSFKDAGLCEQCDRDGRQYAARKAREERDGARNGCGAPTHPTGQQEAKLHEEFAGKTPKDGPPWQDIASLYRQYTGEVSGAIRGHHQIPFFNVTAYQNTQAHVMRWWLIVLILRGMF